MPDLHFFSTIGSLVADLTGRTNGLSAAFDQAHAYILDHFGSNGLLAAYAMGAVISLLFLYQLVRITWMAVKYVAIPSIVLAYVASFVMPYPFASVLPVTVALCSLIMLFKG